MKRSRVLLLVVVAACGSSGERAKPAPDAAIDPLALIRAAQPALGRRIEEAATATAPRYIPHLWGATCPDPRAFTLFRDCRPFTHAVARTWDGSLWIAIGADHAPTCEPGHQPWVDSSQDVMAMRLPSGPGGRYFEGRPFGTSVHLEFADGQFAVTQMNDSLVSLVTPVSLAPGAHVRGAVAMDGYGDGPFDAIMCDGQGPVTDAQPDAPPPATPVEGTVFDEPFHGSLARAYVSPDEHSTYVLLGILDPARGDPGCDAGVDRWSIDGLYLSGGGAAAPFPIRGAPQPAAVSHASRLHGTQQARGWVIWDDVPTTPGSIVRARVVAHSASDVPAERRIDVEGTIEATVCPLRKPSY